MPRTQWAMRKTNDNLDNLKNKIKKEKYREYNGAMRKITFYKDVM